jgi:hypothetical protein
MARILSEAFHRLALTEAIQLVQLADDLESHGRLSSWFASAPVRQRPPSMRPAAHPETEQTATRMLRRASPLNGSPRMNRLVA